MRSRAAMRKMGIQQPSCMTSFSLVIELKDQCKKRTHGLFSSGASSDKLRMENQRLVYAPVGGFRQATTRAALRGAIHVQSHNTTISGQLQSRYISFEDVPESKSDTR